jgi:type III restriction enzyme
MDYFLGKKPTGATTDSKVDLAEVVRDVDELMILNDEAHHIHDERLAWFKSIQDIHNHLLQKDSKLSMQVDVTATPKHDNGGIFVQTVADYPLVEAIYQNVVKHPVLPDTASRAKLVERKSSRFTEKYEDYIHLGYLEWKKVYDEHQKLGKKAVLFVMTDDTKNCDEVAEYLENRYPDLKDAVLVIHTKKNGEISESGSGKKEEELKQLRDASNRIDSMDSPYKAIVSVLILKEGWDVKNVTTIVGLRAYSSKSNILPEQTLGRGLRRMYRDQDVTEYVSVIGTDAFMDFVESIRNEGVELERGKMGEGTKPRAPLVIEVDNENVHKDIEKLDIQIPVLTPRIYREYRNLSDLDVGTFGTQKLPITQFTLEEQREIIFKDITNGEITHKTILDTSIIANYQSVIGYFTQVIMKELRLVGGYDILYGKVKEFVTAHLFEKEVNLEDLNILRNLFGSFNFHFFPKKSMFNKIVGDSHLELEFAAFLENCDDIISYVKNYLAVHFTIDYQNASGDISNYYPDFIVKISGSEIYIVETKGEEDLDDPLKIKRLAQWCDDINAAQSGIRFDWVFVDQETFDSYPPRNFKELVQIFRKYKD